MELYQLQCFLAAASRGNFSRAAEDVHISQSSISKIIGRLEAELGTELFERSKGRISLNSNGILFQKYVTTALQSLEEGTELIRQAASLEKHTVTIGCTASQHFDSILEEVQAQVSQCLFDVKVMNQEELVKSFQQGTIDIGFLESDYRFQSPLFEQVAKQYFVVFLSENHPLAGQKAFLPAQIGGEIVCFTGREDDRRFLTHMFAAEGVRPKVFAEYPDHKATARLINTGAAIGIVPDELYYHRKQATPRLPLVAIPINNQWYRRVYLLRQAGAEAREAGRVGEIYRLLKDKLLEERQLIDEFYREKQIIFEEETV